METLDPRLGSVRERVEYVVQFGYIGGTVAKPLAYWAEYDRYFKTLEEAKAAPPPVRSRFHTGQRRIVKRTTVVTIEPVEFDQ